MGNLKLSNIDVSKYQSKIKVLLANVFVKVFQNRTVYKRQHANASFMEQTRDKLVNTNIVLVLPGKQFAEKTVRIIKFYK